MSNNYLHACVFSRKKNEIHLFLFQIYNLPRFSRLQCNGGAVAPLFSTTKAYYVFTADFFFFSFPFCPLNTMHSILGYGRYGNGRRLFSPRHHNINFHEPSVLFFFHSKILIVSCDAVFSSKTRKKTNTVCSFLE